MILPNLFHLAKINVQNSLSFKLKKKKKKSQNFKVKGFQNKKFCEVLLIYENFENSFYNPVLLFFRNTFHKNHVDPSNPTKWSH